MIKIECSPEGVQIGQEKIITEGRLLDLISGDLTQIKFLGLQLQKQLKSNMLAHLHYTGNPKLITHQNRPGERDEIEKFLHNFST